MKLAHLSPLPPQRSGIADYCARLLPALAERAEVDAYAPGPAEPLEGQPAAVRPIARFAQHRHDYDAYLYHMGNHPAYHQEIYEALCRYPGVVVLHDANLHAFFANHPARWRYVQAMGYEYGLEGVREARQVLAGRSPAPVARAALSGRIADASLGVLVHSREAARALSAATRTPVAYMPLGVALPEPGAVARPELLAGLAPGTAILASFGYIAPAKRLDAVLHCLAHLRDELPPFRYLLVGEPVGGVDVEALVAEHGLQDVVLCTGYVDQPSFRRYLAHTDVGISLRTAPTGGEMSAALLELMAYGKPVLVSGVDAFAELPEGIVLKIAQDQAEAEQLAAALQWLLADPGMRRHVGEQARRYVQEYHAFEAVAGRILDFVQACTWGAQAVSSLPAVP